MQGHISRLAVAPFDGTFCGAKSCRAGTTEVRIAFDTKVRIYHGPCSTRRGEIYRIQIQRRAHECVEQYALILPEGEVAAEMATRGATQNTNPSIRPAAASGWPLGCKYSAKQLD